MQARIYVLRVSRSAARDYFRKNCLFSKKSTDFRQSCVLLKYRLFCILKRALRIMRARNKREEAKERRVLKGLARRKRSICSAMHI